MLKIKFRLIEKSERADNRDWMMQFTAVANDEQIASEQQAVGAIPDGALLVALRDEAAAQFQVGQYYYFQILTEDNQCSRAADKTPPSGS